MKKLELFIGQFDETVPQKRKIENKPYVGYSVEEDKVVYTELPNLEYIEGTIYDTEAVTDLTEDSVLAEANRGKTGTISITRSINNYGTLTLPFDLYTTIGTPLENCTIQRFVGVEDLGNNQQDLQFESFIPTKEDPMVAGYPYRIYSNGNVVPSPMTFEDVTLKVIRNNECASVTHGNWTITGIITKELLSEGTYMMLADGRLAQGSYSSYMSGLRYYLVKHD